MSGNITFAEIDDCRELLGVDFQIFSFSVGFAVAFTILSWMYQMQFYDSKAAWVAKLPAISVSMFAVSHFLWYWYVYSNLSLFPTDGNGNLTMLFLSTILEALAKIAALYYLSYRVFFYVKSDDSMFVVFRALIASGVVINIASGAANTLWNLPCPFCQTDVGSLVLGNVYYLSDIYATFVEFYTLMFYLKHKCKATNFSGLSMVVQQSGLQSGIYAMIFMCFIIIAYSILTTIKSLHFDTWNVVYTILETLKYQIACNYATQVYVSTLQVKVSVIQSVDIATKALQ